MGLLLPPTEGKGGPLYPITHLRLQLFAALEPVLCSSVPVRALLHCAQGHSSHAKHRGFSRRPHLQALDGGGPVGQLLLTAAQLLLRPRRLSLLVTQHLLIAFVSRPDGVCEDVCLSARLRSKNACRSGHCIRRLQLASSILSVTSGTLKYHGPGLSTEA
jgi:hypothetical protein